MGKIYQVEVYGLRGEKMLIDLCNTEEQMKTMTVLQLKEKIVQRLPDGAGMDELRLIFTDKMLDGDSSLLSEYGIQSMSVIHMVIKVPGGLTA
ncbi:ubiquitin-like protein NEDD8 [Leuresthes tenuis]|uniref:ubiquitin-like protein NEDD8 n=1 Tax=Leuresthes tenuis TaxID=355514 RepID=UPI003B5125DC